MNTRICRWIVAALLSGLLFAHPFAAQAAQSFEGCAGFIDTLPATISTQGVWCLRHDLATNIAGGNAITINTNNVTIDCNDFKIGGLAAGDASTAKGIYAELRQNATVRHCNVRGFYYGIDITGGAGHLVEDNRLDNNLEIGIFVTGDHNLVQRNRVFDTGGASGGSIAIGIWGYADVLDNFVKGLTTAGSTYQLIGIMAPGNGTSVAGNRIGDLLLNDTGTAYGIYLDAVDQTISGNRVVAGSATTNGIGIKGKGISSTFCTGNTVAKFSVAVGTCQVPNPDDNMSH